MPYLAIAPEEPFVSFERGMDQEGPRTQIAKGGYEEAVNILLGCKPNGQRHICTANVDSELDSLVTWPAGNAIFVAPFTFSTFSGGVLSFNTHLLIARDTGAVFRYEAGAPGTLTIVRRGFNTSNKLWTDTIFDQWLITLNGRDAPMKYGQHFLGNTGNEARPFLFPVGAKPVSPMGAAIADENWTFNGTSAFVADASVPGGGSRVHTQSLRVDDNNAAAGSAFNSWGTARNFLNGPYPYGGTDFTGTDFLLFQVFKAAGGAANVRIRFGNDAGTDYFEFTQSVSDSPSWQQFRLQRSTATTTGTPNWNSIKRVTFFNDDATAGDDVFFDDVYFLYGNAPPAGQLGITHKSRLVVAGSPTGADAITPTLANIYFSRAAFPDEFPAINVQTISSGNSSLARQNQITALREFGASVLVGTPHALVAWTVNSSGDPVQQTVTSEHGIDSHRGVVETPNGAMLFFWQRGLYVMRSTWRAFGSSKFDPTIQHLWLEQPQWTVGIFDEKTQTLRFWWREKVGTDADPETVTQGIIFDYVRAQDLGEGIWPSTMDQMADFVAPVYVNGVREVVYGRYDSPELFRLGSTTPDSDNPLYSYVRLPWLSTEAKKDKVVKWAGVTVPYASSAEVTAKIRYASNPAEFGTAAFEEVQTLPANPGITDAARVKFGKPSRWAQIQFECFAGQMEIFPPLSLYEYETSRVP